MAISLLPIKRFRMGDPVMHRVKAITIKTVGYDSEYEELWVRFRNNKIFRYPGVPMKLFNDLCVADHAGNYFRERVSKLYRCYRHYA